MHSITLASATLISCSQESHFLLSVVTSSAAYSGPSGNGIEENDASRTHGTNSTNPWGSIEARLSTGGVDICKRHFLAVTRSIHSRSGSHLR